MPLITIPNVVEQVQSDIIVYWILYQGSVNEILFDYGTAYVESESFIVSEAVRVALP